jgi:hypothetical protein
MRWLRDKVRDEAVHQVHARGHCGGAGVRGSAVMCDLAGADVGHMSQQVIISVAPNPLMYSTVVHHVVKVQILQSTAVQLLSNLAFSNTASFESITSIVFDRFAGSTPITAIAVAALLSLVGTTGGHAYLGRRRPLSSHFPSTATGGTQSVKEPQGKFVGRHLKSDPPAT